MIEREREREIEWDRVRQGEILRDRERSRNIEERGRKRWRDR